MASAAPLAQPAPPISAAAPSTGSPTFSPEQVSVVFVLGGPGAGKGTQCARLVQEYGFTHLSAGDLLRAEQERAGSRYGTMIKDIIREGGIVPMEVTVALLEGAIREDVQKRGPGAVSHILIDGFPRKMDQGVHFDRNVCPCRFVLFFDCPEDVMQARLLRRGETSGRADDNADSIRKRFRVFQETSMPVVDYFASEGRVEVVQATKAPDLVFEDVGRVMEKRGFRRKTA